MTAKHTPGPWSLLIDEARGRPRCLIVDTEGNEIVSVNPYRESLSRDAGLIAAAPEMYQLIEKCYKVLHMGVWEVDETDEDVCSQINDIMCNHFGDNWRPRREA